MHQFAQYPVKNAFLREALSPFFLSASYRMRFKFERIGSLSLFVLALIFFISTAGDQAALFIAFSVSPILFFAYGWRRNLWKGSSATT